MDGLLDIVTENPVDNNVTPEPDHDQSPRSKVPAKKISFMANLPET
jgi:hypothetical protein